MAKIKHKLTAAELAEYSDDLAKKCCWLEELKAEKSDQNTAINRQIKDCSLAISRIATIINQGFEDREQDFQEKLFPPSAESVTISSGDSSVTLKRGKK